MCLPHHLLLPASLCRLASHVAYRSGQKKDGLLTAAGVWSRFGLAVPLQGDVPAELLRAVGVVVVFLVLLQEVALVVQRRLRQETGTEKKIS